MKNYYINLIARDYEKYYLAGNSSKYKDIVNKFERMKQLSDVPRSKRDVS